MFDITKFGIGWFSSASPTGAPIPQSTKCGDIVNSGDQVFRASDALACLTSVPFNPAVASRFLKYYNDTLQFQSTLKTLQNPPSSYQQPAVDVLASINRIQQDIDVGNFKNHYAFETALQKVVHAIHDSHVSLLVGISAAFSFGSAYSITSISRDGVELPKIYFRDEVLATQKRDPSALPPSITKINGVDAAEYLTQFAMDNSFGLLEPHADWNDLMACPAAEIQDYYTVFEASAPFFPGESLTFTFENGHTANPVPWLAFYHYPGETGPLTTGGDFFNFFVLNLYPASFTPSFAKRDVDELSPPVVKPGSTHERRSPTSPAILQGWGHPAYPPTPDNVQYGFDGSSLRGTVTGYLLRDTSVGVLSIPSFYAYGEDVQGFSNAIGDFLQLSKQNGMARIVVDLQQNGGGIPLLAIDAFKQFFPSIDPFGGSRLRAHSPADALGNTFTRYYDTQSMSASYYYDLSGSEWVATDRLNANSGQNFTSWGKFYGPRMYNGDYFTNTQRYNLRSYIFDEVVSGGILPHGYGFSSVPSSIQHYEAQDIILLSNGVCASACALFMEMMHHEAQVRTVVAGGRPTDGPMQAPSGTRGALSYTSYNLDQDMRFAESINATTAGLLPDRFQNIWLTYAGVNLRDAIRKGQDVPLQFAYEAADCRIFYTPQTFYNYTNLWKYAANAIWTNQSLCVQGSTGYATTGGKTDTTGPPVKSADGQPQNASPNNSSVLQLDLSTDASNAPSTGVQYDAPTLIAKNAPGVNDPCDPNHPRCNSHDLVCRPYPVCNGQYHPDTVSVHRCVQKCWTGVPISGLKNRCVIGVQCRIDVPTQPDDKLEGTCKGVYAPATLTDSSGFPVPTILLKKRCEGLCLPPIPPNPCSPTINGADPGLSQSAQMASSGGDVSRIDWTKKGSVADMVKAGVAAWK